MEAATEAESAQQLRDPGNSGGAGRGRVNRSVAWLKQTERLSRPSVSSPPSALLSRI